MPTQIAMTRTTVTGTNGYSRVNDLEVTFPNAYGNGQNNTMSVKPAGPCGESSLDSTITWGDLKGYLVGELYSENVTAKILRVAEDFLENNSPPVSYPELVRQTGEKCGSYSSRPIDFWTCGFFPGSIYGLLERATKHPRIMNPGDSAVLPSHVRNKLQVLGQKWSEPLHRMARRLDTHDLGFMILPHMKVRWELFHDESALNSIIRAGVSLYSRFDAQVGAIRSWDHLTWQKGVDIRNRQENFLVIIDSLCNLNLLFYAADHTGYTFLSDAAIKHAKTLMRTHLRPEPTQVSEGYEGMLYSTCHVVNFDPTTGDIKEIRTAQGYTPESTWSRGQAWAILGYAQTYKWTRDDLFLETACGLAEYFMLRMETAPPCVEIQNTDGGITGRYVPLWDFDAPITKTDFPMRDVSAGLIAANGMLLLNQLLISLGRYTEAKRYMENAIKVVNDTLRLSLSHEKERLVHQMNGDISVVRCEPTHCAFDSILRDSTVTWNEQSFSASADHGLVYADYYLIEFGNRLLELAYV